MFSKEIWIGILGYGGGLLSLLAYVLITNNLVDTSSWVYPGLNLAAGLALMIYTFRKKAYANTILNSFWFLISIVAIARLIY